MHVKHWTSGGTRAFNEEAWKLVWVIGTVSWLQVPSLVTLSQSIDEMSAHFLFGGFAAIFNCLSQENKLEIENLWNKFCADWSYDHLCQVSSELNKLCDPWRFLKLSESNMVEVQLWPKVTGHVSLNLGWSKDHNATSLVKIRCTSQGPRQECMSNFHPLVALECWA